jgi:hypothetical protein
MMTICAQDHDRIAFNSNTECPACRLLEQVAELKHQVDHLHLELYEQEKIASEN